MIDTGKPRSVVGYMISGAIASSVVAGAINYNKYKKEEISKNDAIKETIKLTAQGAIATGSATATVYAIGDRKMFRALHATLFGIASIYIIEKVSEKIKTQKLIKE
jgi:energy-converting hydrogenase Eha subunit H